MKQLLIRKGDVVISDVPAPSVGAKNILVQLHHSTVSIGTEISGVKMSALPIWKRALKQPHHAKRVLRMMKDQGLRRVFGRITGMLNAGTPTGYSAAGKVIAVGDLVDAFTVGDFVACAGAGIANHAEIVDVPVNLATRIPDKISTAEACTVTLGAIAMQGVRRAAPTMGEIILVIGLGALGQITQQLLRVNGCRVIGTDVDQERIKVALGNGMTHGIDALESEFSSRVYQLTGGFGVDCAIITAAASGNSELVAQAMRCCRRKGRVVIVGDVGLNLQRHEFYAKELDVLISCSYGPGRYDASYENEGLDYPLPYVRWTENRNMEEYLRLLAEGSINIESLKPTLYSFDKAPEAYNALQGDRKKPMLVVLSYSRDNTAFETTIMIGDRGTKTKKGVIGVACVGAGAFAQMMHLPNLLKHRDAFEIRTICNRTGSTALSVATQFNASKATTDFQSVLNDSNIDLILICTRHDLHADMTLRALRAGKSVLCEKPLALTQDGIEAIEEFYAKESGPKPVLLIGFNRRWAPSFLYVKQILRNRNSPLMATYTMNAGHIPLEHWVHGPEGGGRNLGEACHIYDLFVSLTGSRCTGIQMAGVIPQGRQWTRNDNFTATLTFADGSICNLLYTAMGSKEYGKERLLVFCEGRAIVLSDFKSVEVFGSKEKGWSGISQDKGQEAEIVVLADMIRNGMPAGFLDEQFAVSRIALESEHLLMRRDSEEVS